jgi:hypothetical protein
VEEALTRILTPKRSIDVLREVKAAQVGGWLAGPCLGDSRSAGVLRNSAVQACAIGRVAPVD